MRATTLLLAAGWLTGCAAEADPGDADSTPVDPNAVTIIGLDYAFGGPRTLPPGPTAIAFENRGEVDHEMILIRLKEGVTVEGFTEALESGGDPRALAEGGPAILIARPGQTTETRLLVDLEPGSIYALICNLRDEPEAPPHTALGMLASLEVSSP